MNRRMKRTEEIDRDRQKLQAVAQRALFENYGFKPNQQDIILLESGDDKEGNPEYILFRVGPWEYRYEKPSLWSAEEVAKTGRYFAD